MTENSGAPQSPVSGYVSQATDEIDLLQLLDTLLSRKLMILGCVAGSFLLALIYVSLATPIYRADVLMQVEQKQGGIPGLDEMAGLFSSKASASTEVEVFKSRTVIGRTVDALQLDIGVAKRRLPILGGVHARIFGDSDTLEIGGLKLPSALAGKSMLIRVGEEGAWSLSYDGLQLLVGRVGEVAVGEQGDIQLLVTAIDAAPGTEFTLVKRGRLSLIRSLQARVNVSERGRSTGVLVATLEAADPEWAAAVLQKMSEQYVLQNVERMSEEAAKSLAFLRSQIPGVKTELEAAEDELNNYRSNSGSVDISIETQSLLAQIVRLEEEIALLSLKEAELERQFRPEHPVFLSLNEQKTQMSAKKARYERQIDTLPDTQQALLRLMRTVEVKTQLYTHLLTQAQELDVVRAGTVGNVRILDDAATVGPVKPRKRITLMLALVLGGIFGVVTALVQAALRRGVESPEQIENLGIPVYATVPFSENQIRVAADANSSVATLLAKTNPEDLAVESLRGLRTSIHFAMVGATHNRMMVTGPSPNVGKTFIATNLGVLMAASGDRVILIDADMRRGTMHHYFGSGAENGLSELLSGQANLNNVIRDSGIDNLTYISRGKAPPNPSELLMGRHFSELLAELDGQFDMVLIDTPPALAVTDSSIVGAQVAATLLVARQGVNPPAEIEYARSRLDHAGVAVKGAVLNGVQRSTSKYGYDRYKYYQYDYGSE